MELLHSLVLQSRKNLKNLKFTGLDSPKQALDHNHFINFPHAISYSYNSRGFRDDEWPLSKEELKDAIWCIGDSFTAGVGSPIGHIWPQLLQDKIQRRTINISLDGASNDWIARHGINILKEVEPNTIIVCWSYFHRRESSVSNAKDEDRRLLIETFDAQENAKNFVHNYKKLNGEYSTQIVNLAVPYCLVEDGINNASGFRDPFEELIEFWDVIKGADWPVEYPGSKDLPDYISRELAENKFLDRLDTLKYLVDSGVSFVNYELIDLARDGHHFGKLTSMSVVDGIIKKLNV